jgi:hypothetical protein
MADKPVPPGITLSAPETVAPQPTSNDSKALPPGITLVAPSIAPTPTAAPDTTSGSGWAATGTGFLHGVTNLFYGGAQVGARMGEPLTSPEGGFDFTAPVDQPPADIQQRQQEVDKAVTAREQAYRRDPNVKAHPYLAGAGNIAGEIAATAPLFGPAGLPETIGGRMALATIPGGLVGLSSPVTDTSKESWGQQKAWEVPVGAASAAIGMPIGEAAGKVVKWGARKIGQLVESGEQTAERKTAQETGETAAQKAAATKKVEGAVSKMARSGRLKAGDIMQEMTDARAAGQPYTLLDIDQPGGPVRRLGGTVYRGPGEAGAHMEASQEARTYGIDEATQRSAQGQRLEQGIRDQLASGDAAVVGEGIADARSAASKPLWDKAMAGGSTAPLEHQFGREFEAVTRTEAAAQRRVAEARTKLLPALGKQQTASNVYASSAANQEQRAAASELMDAENELERIRATKEDIRTRLRQAQADGTANAPGAVWSPHLQTLMDNPRVKAGINKGYIIERDNANAEGRPINAREWAIVGQDENGDPIVGKVPNMRLIQMAKEGLDALLEGDQYRDKYTRRLTKEGQGIDKLRRALLAEGDRLNPDWKAAREAWAGPSARLEALSDGKAALSRAWSRRDFAERWNEMNDSEREVFKIGVADKLIEDLDFANLSRNQARALVNSTATREKLRLMFGSTAEFNQFIKFVTRERTMWETGTDIMRGAATAARRAADEQENVDAVQAGLHAAHGAGHLKVGNLVGAVRSFLSAATHLGWGRQDPGVNLQVAKLLTDPNIELRLSGGDILRLGPQPPETPATWGDAARGLGGDIGAVISQPMTYSAPESFSPPR